MGSGSRANSGETRQRALCSAKLYLITPAGDDLAQLIEGAVAGGVGIVQVRDRTLDDRELLRRLEDAREVTAELGVPLVVNDRADLALLVEADFVHVGQDDVPTSAARKLGLGVGLSTHAAAEVDAAEADYLGVGPVYETPTKAGRPAAGLDFVRYAVAHARVPWFAIGGIDASNAGSVVAAGASRLAVVRAITEASDPEAAARALCAVLPTAR